MEERKIMHQNLQASNLVVRHPEELRAENVFVVDFASAVDLGRRTGPITGNFHAGKATLDQQQGKSISALQAGFKIDLYCLGLIFYEV
jgi:hypothetical protein